MKATNKKQENKKQKNKKASDQKSLFAQHELNSTLDDTTFALAEETLRVDLLNMQFDLQKSDYSIIILLAGDDRPGVVDAARNLHHWMDERLIDTHAMFTEGRGEDVLRPFAWRYWSRLPTRGRTGLFLGAWPSYIFRDAVRADWNKNKLDEQLAHIEHFERQLAVDGTLLLKFWLHLPKGELRKRLKKAKDDPDKSWIFDRRDEEILQTNKAGMAIVERIIERTDTACAPWNIIESSDSHFRDYSLAQQIMRQYSQHQTAREKKSLPTSSFDTDGKDTANSNVEKLDLHPDMNEDEYRDTLSKLQSEIGRLTRKLSKKKKSCVFVFEGVDAAGKGGSIRRLVASMPIQNSCVIPIAAPTEEEKAHHYLWRFWRHMPRYGDSVIFDRSWYGRVLVERVEGFATEEQWSRAYEEINDFERGLNEAGVAVIKFWLQIDSEEQLKRFEARATTPYKKYKLTDEDRRNRSKSGRYQQAAADMFALTSPDNAPWNMIAANNKYHARIEVLRIACLKLQVLLSAK